MSLSITKNYATGSPLTKAHLDAAFGDIETKLNTTLIAGSEIQAATIATSNIIDSAITTAKINDLGCTTGKINDLAITAGKLAADSVVTSKILDANVTTPKLADASVTQAKRAALGQQLSSSSGSVSNSTTSYADITNLTVTITTTGRPIMIAMIQDGSGSVGAFRANGSAGAIGAAKLLRDATSVSEWAFGQSATSNDVYITPSFVHIDIVAAGTYVYKMQYKKSVGSVSCEYMKLVAFEL